MSLLLLLLNLSLQEVQSNSILYLKEWKRFGDFSCSFVYVNGNEEAKLQDLFSTYPAVVFSDIVVVHDKGQEICPAEAVHHARSVSET